MADLVSPIVDIISRLWPCCATHTSYLCKLQDNKILLRNAMKELKEARDDVQRKVDEAETDPNEPKKRTDTVSGWLQRVETIDGEVEVILQKADEQLSRARCLGGCCPPNNCWSNYKVGKSIAKKISLVDELKVNGKFEELTYRLPPPSVQDMNLEPTVGMESMFDKVWSLINSTNDTQPVSNIIGLYGQGGVGKTTLLEKINNEFHNKISTGEHGFDYVVIFVVVSKPINYEDIQKKIGERLGLSLQGDGDEKSSARKIFNALRNKNYVLLLDDIWEEVDKKRIGIPIHPPQGNSSKLIFTTRSEKVCGLMDVTHTFPVECLPWDKAWSLFQDKVGEKALNYLSEARGLAKDVAKECGGLPLALITIGRVMSTKKSVREWRDALAQLKRYASDFQDMRDKVLARLKLSYDNLPNETEKSCFCYCALFPEDYSIEISKLVDYWIAEGFLDGFDNNLDEARNRGHTIIGSLKCACLLESSDQEENHVKMHDVIRDLALWIVNDCSRSSDESGNNSDNKYLVAANDPCKKWENAERIFWDATHYTTSSSSSSINEEENPLASPNLLTLMVRKMNLRNHYLRLSPSFFQHMPLLRVLDLSNISLDYTIPNSIGELHELQYLNLSGTGHIKLPVELRKLVKLKFLVLHDISGLRRIPAGVIANLSELQVLDLDGFENWELEDGPSFSELDGLKQLQEVRISIITDVVLKKFLCNRKLQMVCTHLDLRLSLASSSRRVLDLNKFRSLKYLLIYGYQGLKELVLYEGLLSTLERLSLDNVPKLNSILWMGGRAQPDDLLRPHSQSLEIKFSGCHELTDLTWLVYMENLKTLDVCKCNELETIIEFGGDGLEGGAEGGEGGVFRRLKTLNLVSLPELKSICRHALAFPSIETISISQCPKLKKLPLGSGSNVNNNTLKLIEGETSWWNELQWEDETIKSKFLPYYKKAVSFRKFEIRQLRIDG